jgi:hypothetical protein
MLLARTSFREAVLSLGEDSRELLPPGRFQERPGEGGRRDGSNPPTNETPGRKISVRRSRCNGAEVITEGVLRAECRFSGSREGLLRNRVKKKNKEDKKTWKIPVCPERIFGCVPTSGQIKPFYPNERSSILHYSDSDRNQP